MSTPEDARQALKLWRKKQDSQDAMRDPLVRAAIAQAGLTKEEVHILTRLGRTTIDRIMTRGEGQ